MYHETYQDLVRFLYRKVWDPDRAQDLAQETFVRALNEDPDNPRSWLFTVAGNLARDEARGAIRRRRHLVLLKNEAEAKSASTPNPGEDVEADERREAVRRALETLNERDRELLLLWDAGLNYHEIAERSGLKRGAIGTTLTRARKRLVEAYDSLEGDNVARG